jgi:peroxiredoxin
MFIQSLILFQNIGYARPVPDYVENFSFNEVIADYSSPSFGQSAPDFTLSGIDGSLVTLSELRGEEVLLVFWNISCPYCAAKVPLLNQLHEDGLKVVAIALGDSRGKVKKYIDQMNVKFDILPDGNRTVGKAYDIDSVPQPFLIDTDGTIAWSGPEDGSEIWNYLNSQEIQVQALTASLVSHWSMDDYTSDTNVVDSSGNGLDGTAQQNTSDLHTDGPIGGALSFDGSDYINLGSPALLDDLPSGDFSVSVWINDQSSSDHRMIIGVKPDETKWILRKQSVGSGASILFRANHSTTSARFITPEGSLEPNIWHHIVAAWDADTKTCKIYINGSESSYTTATPGVGTYNSDASYDKEIGRASFSGGGHYFEGAIDQIKIFNKVLSQHEIYELYEERNSSLDLEVYFVPYVGDIDGSIETDWYTFYNRLRQWHDANSIPGSFSFYPETMTNMQFNSIIGDMYDSNNIELLLKGEDEFEGTRLDYMTYSEVTDALMTWQAKFIYELEQIGYSDVNSPVTYNQLQQRFNETIRDAAHDVGFQMYFEHGVSDEYGYIDMLPDFDITQYSVSLTISGSPGPNEAFKQPEDVIQEVLDFSDEEMIYINGIKVVPLLCHQQDFRITEESSDINEAKWDIYTSLLTMAEDDSRIQLVKPEEVYELRHKYLRDYIFTDFGTSDHGWTAAGLGQSKFEIGVPIPFDPCEESCLTDCFGTGPSEDHSPNDVNAACTNLDGHMAPNAYILTNSLTSPVYDFSGRTDVALELWRFMEIEGEDYDLCYFQYKDEPVGEWTSFDIYGANEVNDVNWVHYAKNLSSIADGKSYFQMRFYCTTDDWYEGSGLCLDDIKLSWIVGSDFNIDKKVDFFDYTGLATAWLTDPNDPNFNDIYDLADNNVIDTADLDIFINDWLLGAQP